LRKTGKIKSAPIEPPTEYFRFPISDFRFNPRPRLSAIESLTFTICDLILATWSFPISDFPFPIALPTYNLANAADIRGEKPRGVEKRAGGKS
jgi:hypothetical protein